MSRLPLIVGFGGVNAAGRSSAHHAYRRLVIDDIEEIKRERTYASLAALMQRGQPCSDNERRSMLQHTLIRKLEKNLFDSESILLQKTAELTEPSGQETSFVIKKIQLPSTIPDTWIVDTVSEVEVKVTVSEQLKVLLPVSYTHLTLPTTPYV